MEVSVAQTKQAVNISCAKADIGIQIPSLLTTPFFIHKTELQLLENRNSNLRAPLPNALFQTDQYRAEVS